MTHSKGKNNALTKIVEVLSPFSREDQSSIIRSATVFFNLGANVDAATTSKTPELDVVADNNDRKPVFSGHAELSPKVFLADKNPQTDSERVACLAYYLTHYRDLKSFKTIDISTLNTEAAQKKLSNSTYTTSHAIRKGYLAPAQGSHKQISAIGERFVEALPDREAARAVMEKYRPRKKKRRKKAVVRKQ